MYLFCFTIVIPYDPILRLLGTCNSTSLFTTLKILSTVLLKVTDVLLLEELEKEKLDELELEELEDELEL